MVISNGLVLQWGAIDSQYDLVTLPITYENNYRIMCFAISTAGETFHSIISKTDILLSSFKVYWGQYAYAPRTGAGMIHHWHTLGY